MRDIKYREFDKSYGFEGRIKYIKKEVGMVVFSRLLWRGPPRNY